MQRPLRQQEPPDAVAPEQRTSNEVVSLIRKLHWIGLEKEAESLLAELARRRATGEVSVIAPSRETD
jgi:hypothetical protein